MGPFAAAAIAEADPMKTGWACFRFAKIIYVMPFLMAYTHILLTGTPAQNIFAAIASATSAQCLFSIMSTGFFYVSMSLVECLLCSRSPPSSLLFRSPLTGMAPAMAIFIAVYFVTA